MARIKSNIIYVTDLENKIIIVDICSLLKTSKCYVFLISRMNENEYES